MGLRYIRRAVPGLTMLHSLSPQLVTTSFVATAVSTTPSTNPIAVSATAFADVAGLSLTVTTRGVNEPLLLLFAGMANHPPIFQGFNAYVQWVIDDVVIGAPVMASNSGSGYGFDDRVDIGFSRMYTMVSTGAHTIKVQCKRATVGATYWNLYDCVATVVQFR